MQEPKKFNFKRLVGKNIIKRPYRNIATIFAYAIIAATLLTSLYLTSGALESLDNGMSRMGADLLVVPVGYTAAGQSAILAVVTIGVMASLWSAWQSSRMNPYDAIRYQ
jgi:ABC-type antimicrobial peptide transport system permease subunit